MKDCLPRVFLALACVVACAPSAICQCVRGNIKIAGRIENYSSGRATQVDVTVFLKKGKVTETSKITGPDFSVDVPFDSLSSYSFLWGHRCHNAPVSVIVEVTSDGAKLAEEQFSIKDDFRLEAWLRYSLNHKLVIHEGNPARDGGSW